MISAPSRLPRSSGSKSIVVAAGLLLAACAGPRPVVRQPPKPVDDRPETTRVYDPSKDMYVTLPAGAVPDTVSWQPEDRPPAVKDPAPGNPEPVEKPVNPLRPAETRTRVSVTLALPVDTDGSEHWSDPRLNRFVQYYAGLRLAIEEESTLRQKISLRITDAGRLSAGGDPGAADIIIGPYDRDSIEQMLARLEGSPKILISPWLPAFTPRHDGSRFIQLTPGLERHAEAIMHFIQAELRGHDVVLVARDDPAERSRLNLFRQQGTGAEKELVVKDKSATLESLDLGRYFHKEGTVFVMPYYARQDEAFVNRFLRKVQAEKGDHPVAVFGLPQWTGFGNLNPNAMEAVGLYLSEPAWPSADPALLLDFRERFFARHHTMPDINAMQGYDLGRWLVETLDRKGFEGLTGASGDWKDGLCSGFAIRPVHAPGHPEDVLYYENGFVRIVRFTEQDFTTVR